MSPFYFPFDFRIARCGSRCKSGAKAESRKTGRRGPIDDQLGERVPHVSRAHLTGNDKIIVWRLVRVHCRLQRLAHRPDTTTIVIAAASGLQL